MTRFTFILRLHHVQLAMPRGEEAKARQFYCGVLGLTELEKPPNLAKRGGVWFSLGDLQLHLGIEDEFRPARKAHPAFLVQGMIELRDRLLLHGYTAIDDAPLPGYQRFYVADPFGNRLEFLEGLSHAVQALKGSPRSSAAPTFTAKPGQYLAFIDSYSRMFGRAPSEADMQRHFGVTAPSVHQMVLTLERARLIQRSPGVARSIKLLVRTEDLPILQ